jgi:UDP-N-acetylmuramate--alanine ligase
MEKLVEYFTNFASHVQYGLITNYDCPLARQLSCGKKVFRYSIKDAKADIFAYNIKTVNRGIEYSIDGKSFRLNLIGRFNVSNALSAISACVLLGIDKFDAAKALEGFTGIKRRLETVGTVKDVTFYDDFAHNTSKNRALLYQPSKITPAALSPCNSPIHRSLPSITATRSPMWLLMSLTMTIS